MRYECFEPVTHPDDKVLILGTMPSPASISKNFYYGHPQNRFWNVLAVLYHEATPKTTSEKQKLLKRRKIALWDVLSVCERNGASDASIAKESPNDIHALLAACPSIALIALNGAKAYALFEKYFKDKIRIPTYKMPSTSPANAAYTLERLCGEWKIIVMEGEQI